MGSKCLNLLVPCVLNRWEHSFTGSFGHIQIVTYLVPRMTSPDGEGAGDVDMSPALLMPQDPTPIAKHTRAKIFLYHQYVLERQWP